MSVSNAASGASLGSIRASTRWVLWTTSGPRRSTPPAVTNRVLRPARMALDTRLAAAVTPCSKFGVLAWAPGVGSNTTVQLVEALHPVLPHHQVVGTRRCRASECCAARRRSHTPAGRGSRPARAAATTRAGPCPTDHVRVRACRSAGCRERRRSRRCPRSSSLSGRARVRRRRSGAMAPDRSHPVWRWAPDTRTTTPFGRSGPPPAAGRRDLPSWCAPPAPPARTAPNRSVR